MITKSRLTQLLQKRAKKPKKFARPTLPDKAERLYLGAMRRYADVLIEVMRDQLGYRKDSPFDWRTKQAEHKIPLDEVADLTLKHGKAQAKRVLGLADQDMAPGHLIRGWKAANVALIQGLTDDSFDAMRKLIDQTRGRRVEEIADQIEGLFGTTRARAELIARDQTLKLNAQINQEACRTAGIEWYTWSTSQDGSVRDTHAELNGKKFRFDDPPVVNKYGDTANPGEDYQCRCVPIPYVPEIDEEMAGQEPEQAAQAEIVAAPQIQWFDLFSGVSGVVSELETMTASMAETELTTMYAVSANHMIDIVEGVSDFEHIGMKGAVGLYYSDTKTIKLAQNASGSSKAFVPVESFVYDDPDPVRNKLITLRHEVGHMVHLSGAKLTPEVDAVIQKAYKNSYAPISRYAGTSAEEFFAECYAVYMTDPELLRAVEQSAFDMVETVISLVRKHGRPRL